LLYDPIRPLASSFPGGLAPVAPQCNAADRWQRYAGVRRTVNHPGSTAGSLNSQKNGLQRAQNAAEIGTVRQDGRNCRHDASSS